MRITENKPINARLIGDKIIGIIELDKLAIPETVEVTVLGEPIIPKSFDIYGNPCFTEQQQALFRYMAAKASVPLTAEITYDEKTFSVPSFKYDNINGIKRAASTLEGLNEVLRNRAIFRKFNKSKRLQEFVIFGKYYLDSFGQVMFIEGERDEEICSSSDVEHYEVFRQNNKGKGLKIIGGNCYIPEINSVCPCCGKKITISDVKKEPCKYKDGEFYHKECLHNFIRETEIYTFCHQIMGNVYKNFSYDLLPNGYCHDKCCAHIPWFLFHTIDGDIVIGKRKRVISIEWKGNFKFDVNKLFDSEDVTKWKDENGQGIHAWSVDKAIEYLTLVRNTK